jgi:hypothetical protein
VTTDDFNVVTFKRYSDGNGSGEDIIPIVRQDRLLAAGRTIIVTAGERHTAADEGIAALMEAKIPFYQRNRKIQRIAPVKAKDADGNLMMVPGIMTVDAAMMGRALGLSARWQRYDVRQKKHVSIDPPEPVVRQILGMVGEWPFAPLRGIVQCPTLRRDGTLLDREGYDEATGLVLTSSVPMPPISRPPTREEAKMAAKLLESLLEESPIKDPDSLAVALSMMITPVVRGALTVAPLHLISAPLAGTGKSYLADCAAMIATGERCAVEAMGSSWEETEKRLVGAALSGFPIIGIDNIKGLIEGDFFCQITERPLMSLRALGKSDEHRIENVYTTLANGNNAGVAEDMVRRTIRCGMDANMEHPENRIFKGRPFDDIRRHRGKYVAAALTIPPSWRPVNPPKNLHSRVSRIGHASSAVRSCGSVTATLWRHRPSYGLPIPKKPKRPKYSHAGNQISVSGKIEPVGPQSSSMLRRRDQTFVTLSAKSPPNGSAKITSSTPARSVCGYVTTMVISRLASNWWLTGPIPIGQNGMSNSSRKMANDARRRSLPQPPVRQMDLRQRPRGAVHPRL